MPHKIHLLFTELMLQADEMSPESMVYEIEDLQDQLINFYDPDAKLSELRKLYMVLAKAKQDFRLKS